MQTQTPFLDRWLVTQATTGLGGGGSPPHARPQPTTARDILQAWADLRNHSLRHRLLQSLQALVDAQSTLHVADPQAKLLISILSSTSSPPPPEARRLIYRLLYVWVRKSARPSPTLLDSAVPIIASSYTYSSSITSHGEEAFVLLGAITAQPSLPETSRRDCLDRLCSVLENGSVGIGSSLSHPELVLAGIGYALSRSSDNLCFGKIVGFLLRGWRVEDGVAYPTVSHGLMVLALVEWLVMGLINSRSLENIDSLCRELLPENMRVSNYAMFVVVMSVAGVLRAFRRAPQSSGVELNPNMRHKLECSIREAAKHVLARVVEDYELDGDHEIHLLVQCIALGLARCGPFAPSGTVLRCICLALLNDVFPLSFFTDITSASPFSLDRVNEHLDSVIFREAGAVSGVLCNQYASTDESSRTIVENCMWVYCERLYSKLRTTFLASQESNKKVFKELEMIGESIFLMVVVFSAAVVNQKLDSKSSYNVAIRSEVAANVLVAFSCIEYLRRLRWPDYTDVVRRTVLTLQESSSASAIFVVSMPSYDDLTNKKEGLKYCWAEDDVQTARILFYLRVIPTCVGYISSPVFREKLAPIMFLYMCHPNMKVSQASHSVFVAFMSSGKEDSNEDEQIELKEQLVFYYLQRALEFYPRLTPFKGMAAGISALVRYLPAGSPAIFYCINSLVEKASSLYSLAIEEDADLWKNWEGESEPCKKVLELLLHLITIVDIQVLPNMLKLLAHFIIQLPKEGQKIVLDEIYSKVAESDDVIRKPTLVSWLHSLSYLSSRANSLSSGSKNELNAASHLNLNQSHSRL